MIMNDEIRMYRCTVMCLFKAMSFANSTEHRLHTELGHGSAISNQYNLTILKWHTSLQRTVISGTDIQQSNDFSKTYGIFSEAFRIEMTFAE